MKTPRMWSAAPLAALLAFASSSAQHCGGPACGPSGGPNCGPTRCGGMYTATSHDSCWENHIWPNQYIQPSRRGICQAFDTMAANGWRHHNLLSELHFDTNTNELTEAGRLKVQWIANEAPAHRRSVFVQRGVDQQQTAARVASAQELAAASTAGGPAPEVYDTHIRDVGRPAGAVDAMFTGFRTGQMAPVLPQSGGASASGAAVQ
jgi:hypothetical protein